MSGTLQPPWPKGVSGNPTGRPKTPEWLKGHGPELLRLQLGAALTGRVPLAPAGEGDDPEIGDDGMEVPATKTQVVPPRVRHEVAESLLNRIYGRAALNEDGADEGKGNSRLAELYSRTAAVSASADEPKTGA